MHSVFSQSLAREAAIVLLLSVMGAAAISPIKRFFASSPVRDVALGDTINLKPNEFLGSRFVVLVTSSACRYCRTNSEFHRKLIAEGHKRKIPFLVLSREVTTVPHQISAMLGTNDKIGVGGLETVGIQGTPTIVLVENRRISGLWIGALSEPQQDALLSRLDSSIHALSRWADSYTREADHYHEVDKLVALTQISSHDFSSLLARSQLVDVRSREAFERSHNENAINLPSDELGAVMQIELRPDKKVILDCSRTDISVCMISSGILSHGGFRDVWLFDAGAVGASCSRSHL